MYRGDEKSRFVCDEAKVGSVMPFSRRSSRRFIYHYYNIIIYCRVIIVVNDDMVVYYDKYCGLYVNASE